MTNSDYVARYNNGEVIVIGNSIIYLMTEFGWVIEYPDSIEERLKEIGEYEKVPIQALQG